MTTSGWCPFANKVEIPASNFAEGAADTLAVCLHIAVGTFLSCRAHFKNASSGVSAHFCIGPKGELDQFVSIDDTAFAQGLSYERATGRWYTNRRNEGKRYVNPTWLLLQPGMNINPHVISFEHAGKPGDALTPAMIATQTKALRWVAAERGLIYRPGTTLIGHYMLDNKGRSFCPGPAFDLQVIAARANPPVLPVEPGLPPGTFPVNPKLRAYWERSGGIWQADRHALGYATTPLENDGVQEFQRGALRLNPDGTISPLLRSEWE